MTDAPKVPAWEDTPRIFARRIAAHEAEAWEALAMIAETCPDLNSGLCCTITWNVPYLALVRSMTRRMEAHAPSGQDTGSYWWSRTRRGWDARATFCWKMAAECWAEHYAKTEGRK